MESVVAAFVFFTRLPLWRLRALRTSGSAFRRVITYWALVGWLTGGVMSGVVWLSAQLFPLQVAIVFAMLGRVLVTGALHEDGLADFMDGFGGGGGDRERTLEIMKDSHTGVYGVAGLIFYFLLLFLSLSGLQLPEVCLVILIADPFCKFVASQVTLFLPYARTAGTSKSGVVYDRMSAGSFALSAFFGLLPLALVPHAVWLMAAFFPLAVCPALLLLMKRRIGGYTGDCCGALFLLCELSFYLGSLIILT